MRNRGFTLLEVLIALSILAIALTSAFRAMGASARTAGDLRDRTLADWVADNRLAELRASKSFPPPGNAEGVSIQAGKRFRWREQISESANPQMRSVNIRVYSADEGPDTVVSSLSGLLVRAPQ
ncbi:MAG: type II secretion system minor pseudopilin GspI [Azonexus sp.]|nr:type II secretion system minor pseudopilin GspI [Azonexus sp.]